MFTLACGLACASLQLTLPNDNAIAPALFLLAALSAGALLGKWIDRRTHRKRAVFTLAALRDQGRDDVGQPARS